MLLCVLFRWLCVLCQMAAALEKAAVAKRIPSWIWTSQIPGLRYTFYRCYDWQPPHQHHKVERCACCVCACVWMSVRVCVKGRVYTVTVWVCSPVFAAWHSCVAAHWSTYHCYKQAPSQYDLRCLKATLNPNKQTPHFTAHIKLGRAVITRLGTISPSPCQTLLYCRVHTGRFSHDRARSRPSTMCYVPLCPPFLRYVRART